MASFSDLMSSPDPLVDETPSSMRPVSRRTTRNLSQQPSSMLSIPENTPRMMSSSRRSPRKQTFELDVGNELSPQKILVTVEAENEMRHNTTGISRRLFTTSSPTRSVNRRREVTTTTTVPLRGLTDDEGGDFGSEMTPRRRTLGSKNSTPKPRGKKRSGTPLRKTPRPTRQRTDQLESEASLMSDALLETDANIGEPTPKPRTRARKTPKKAAGTPVAPSSKPTGRKRGRPRKALVPEEVAILTDAVSEADGHMADVEMAQSEGMDSAADFPSEFDVGTAGIEEMSEQDVMESGGPPPLSSPTPDNTIRMNRSKAAGADEISDAVEPSLHEARMTDDVDVDMADDYMAEALSEFESEAGEADGTRHMRQDQDTLAHASDFSMIAVESLPSFQASFRASKTNVDSEPHFSQDIHSVGDETNLIINQTLESLKGNMQAPFQSEISLPGDFDAQSAKPTSPAPGKSSPRRPKVTPLSRQLFAHKSLVADESFSSIPESILQAATPGILPMKPTAADVAQEDMSMYDDSFSEIPDTILKAATPKPPTRSARLSAGISHSSPAAAGVASSSRLPTPDNTSSSATGSKSAHSDEKQKSTGAIFSNARNTSDLNFRSSPPAIRYPPTDDINTENLNLQSDQNIAGTPSSSSDGASPELAAAVSESPKASKMTLEPPLPSQRPTLSPIVRVGRTLQNIMSDRSSPPGRGSSLGSPFGGSPRNDQSLRHSTMVKSDDGQTPFNLPKAEPIFNPVASLAQNIRSNLSQIGIVGRTEDPFGHDLMQTGSSRKAAHKGQEGLPTSPQRGQSRLLPSMTSSTRAAPPSSEEINANESSPTAQRLRRLSASQLFGNANSSIFGARGSTSTRMTDIDAANEQEDEQPSQEGQEQPTQEEQDIYEEDEEQQEQPIPEQQDMSDQDGDGDEKNYQEDAEMGEAMGDAGDDFDMWDIEASRSTPHSTELSRAEVQGRQETEREKKEAKEQTQPQPKPPVQAQQAQAQADGQINAAPRRFKLPSPRRRSSRRLIYKDEINSPSQIEIEESPQREGVEPQELAQEPAQEHSVEEPVKEQMDTAEAEQFSSISPGESQPDPVEKQVQRQLQPVEEEEFSLIAQRFKENEVGQPEKPAPAKSRFFGAFDIMSFFSSPAALPPANPAPHGKTQAPAPESVARPWFEPQLMQSVEKPLPEERRSAIRGMGLFPSIPQKEFRPSPERRTDLFSPGTILKSTDTIPDTYAATSPSPIPSPSIPEQQSFPYIPQKLNFTPRSAASRNTASLFTPSDRQSTPVDQTDDQDEEAHHHQQQQQHRVGFLHVPGQDDDDEYEEDQPGSSSMMSEPEYERFPPRANNSRWDRTLSPTKSCLRSPLKPRTPGRVVEFSAHALSPMAQTQARANGRRAGGAGAGNSHGFVPQGPPLLPPVYENKENQHSSASSSEAEEDEINTNNDPNSFSRSVVGASTPDNNKIPTSSSHPTCSTSHSATASSSSSSTALSQTIWTKPHWVRLDELLQHCRQDPLTFQQQRRLPPKHQRQRSFALLGKEVAAQGEKMVLQSWHLDIVDAFRHEVGGWDERVLAKRLFALIAGEKRRRTGKLRKGARGKVVV